MFQHRPVAPNVSAPKQNIFVPDAVFDIRFSIIAQFVTGVGGGDPTLKLFQSERLATGCALNSARVESPIAFCQLTPFISQPTMELKSDAPVLFAFGDVLAE